MKSQRDGCRDGERERERERQIEREMQRDRKAKSEMVKLMEIKIK